MSLLLALAVPLAVFGLTIGDDDDDLPEEPTIEGTDEADRLEGTQATDFIDGLDGNDILNGAAGNDLILGRGVMTYSKAKMAMICCVPVMAMTS